MILSLSKSLTTLQQSHNKALVELENYKLLVDSIEDYAIFLLDPNGIVMSWNKGAERNKGYKSSEIIGKHFSIFYTQQDVDAQKPQKELEIAQRIGRIEDEDWRVRKNGSRFWANVIITALRNPSGELVGFAKVTRNLTDRKRQEDELRKANMQLRKQQQELQRLNDSKNEFISLASHQLRTPATITKQLLGVLLAGYSDKLTPAQTTFIQKAQSSNERQIFIVNSLLEVAQLDAGKVVLHKTMADLKKMVSDVIDEQSEIIHRRKQTVSLRAAANVPKVAIDTKYFRMAIENIIDNASKYTHESGTIKVSIKLVAGVVVIGITDNGVGIAAADIDSLFKKFNRIPNELSEHVSGSGLGLYWVRKVIELHGGTITVKSRPHRGTTFTISVPVES